MIVAGIDVGARSVKALLIDEQCKVLGKAQIRTRADFAGVAREVLDAALADAGIAASSVDYVATTGFGRYNVPFRDLQITEVTCVARGAAHLFPECRFALDVGAQSTRALRYDERGRVREFKTNDKCAAGAGAFLERAARYLEIGLEDIGPLSMKSEAPQTISSVCAVLAESEIINHVSDGQAVENILAGIHHSLASRAQAFLSRLHLEDELTFVGGVARQAGMVRALESELQVRVNLPEEPGLVAALGAALLGLQRLQKREEAGRSESKGEALSRVGGE